MSDGRKIARSDDGSRGSDIDTPGNAFKRNFNRNPSGRMKLRMARGHGSRSKSARSG